MDLGLMIDVGLDLICGVIERILFFCNILDFTYGLLP